MSRQRWEYCAYSQWLPDPNGDTRDEQKIDSSLTFYSDMSRMHNYGPPAKTFMRLGLEGWELVSTLVCNAEGNKQEVEYLFKRPLSE